MMIDRDWRGKEYAFFSHKKCEAFPCHDTEDEDNFNCLFCYCPLYFLEDCGGENKQLKNGAMDCSGCSLPHDRESYGYITSRLQANIHMVKDEYK